MNAILDARAFADEERAAAQELTLPPRVQCRP